MKQAFSLQYLQSLYAFPFQDPSWKQKLLIASLLILLGFIIPIVPLILLAGYSQLILHRIISEEGDPFLPTWSDLPNLLASGVKLFAARLILSVPFLILLVGVWGLIIAPGLALKLFVATQHSIPSNLGTLSFLSIVSGAALLGLLMPLSLLVGPLLPTALGHVVAKNEVAALFRIHEWWPIFRANLIGFVHAYFIMMGTWYVAIFILQLLNATIVLCCFFPFVLSVFGGYLTVVSDALYAQTYLIGVQILSRRAVA
jgi:hypothetical protein